MSREADRADYLASEARASDSAKNGERFTLRFIYDNIESPRARDCITYAHSTRLFVAHGINSVQSDEQTLHFESERDLFTAILFFDGIDGIVNAEISR